MYTWWFEFTLTGTIGGFLGLDDSSSVIVCVFQIIILFMIT